MAATAAAAAAVAAVPAAAAPVRQSGGKCMSVSLNRAFFGTAAGLAAPQRATVAPATARSLTVRAGAEKYQVIEPINGDPFVGSFETPVTSSPLVAWFLSNLPAYRTSVNPLLRGVEVGLAHGFLLVGPFVKTGPLRTTEVAGIAGTLAAAGLVSILSVCLTIYGIATFKEGEPSQGPSLTLTGRQKEADKLQTAEGWASFSGGFFFGGLSGAAWAYILLYVVNLPYPVK
jgi:photosystem I subunit 11